MSSLARHAFSPVALLLCVMLLSGRPQAFQGALAQKRLLTSASCSSRPSPFTPPPDSGHQYREPGYCAFDFRLALNGRNRFRGIEGRQTTQTV